VYEQPHGRRIGPALVAVLVLLAGAAGAGAYLFARQILTKQTDQVATGPSQTTQAGSPPTSESPRATGNQTGAQTGTQTGNQPGTPIGTQPPNQPTSPDACPVASSAAVKAAGRPGNLQRVLYVEARLADTPGAEAWICRDSDGTLYYQGHDRSGPFTASESQVTILLGTGVKGTVTAAGVGFLATNPAADGQTQYIVNREVLTVVTPAFGRTEYTVTRYSPV
jgi:hypothetical protein